MDNGYNGESWLIPYHKPLSLYLKASHTLFNNAVMKQLLVVSLVIILFVCCNNGKLNIQLMDGMTVIDSIPKSDTLDDIIAGESGRFFPIFYIGKRTDTITLNKEPVFQQSQILTGCEAEPIIDTPFTSQCTTFNGISLKVFDKPYLGHTIKFIHYNAFSTPTVDSVRTIKTLPLFLFNGSGKPFNLCEISKFVLQVKLNKSWKDAYVHNNWCRQNEEHILIPADNLIVAKYPCYNGDSVMICRIKAVGYNDSCYSNTFGYAVSKWRVVD